MLTLLNTAILTADGDFRLKLVTLQDARVTMMAYGADEWQSAIGHDATAQILTDLLGDICGPVPVNRIDYRQGVGDVALVFKLRGRAPEGKILNRAEVEAIGYDFKLLTRLK